MTTTDHTAPAAPTAFAYVADPSASRIERVELSVGYAAGGLIAAVPTTFTEPDVQTITFYAEPDHMLNANDRAKGWRIRRRVRTRYWVGVAKQLTEAKLRNGDLRPVERAHIVVTVTWPSAARRDVNNWQPTIKPIIDGIVKAGLLPDDDDTHVTGPDMRRGYYASKPALPRITISVAIREVTA